MVKTARLNKFAICACLFVSWLFLGMAIAPAAEGEETLTLDQFLSGLGYEAISLHRTPENHLVAKAQVEGQARTFLVDTGWTLTALDASAARELKQPGELGIRLGNAPSNLDTNALVIMRRLEFGPVELRNQPAMDRRLRAGGLKQDGVLGCDFFLRNQSVIDCAGAKLYIRRARLPESILGRLELELNRRGFAEVPLERQRSIVMSVESQVNNLPLTLLVDTGAAHTILRAETGERLNLETTRKRRPIRGVGRIGSTWYYDITADAFSLGGVRLTNVSLGVAELSRWGLSETNRIREVDGLLGGDLLPRLGTWIVFPSRKMWIDPRKSK